MSIKKQDNRVWKFISSNYNKIFLKKYVFQNGEFTGYKVALKVGKKFYSPATGVEYKPGPVEKCESAEHALGNRHRCSKFSLSMIYDQGKDGMYNKDMKGRTSVFEDKGQAIYIYSSLSLLGEKPVLLRMTLSGGLMRGTYCPLRYVVAGRFIVSIEEELVSLTHNNVHTVHSGFAEVQSSKPVKRTRKQAPISLGCSAKLLALKL